MELYGAAGVLINADGFLEVVLMVEMIAMIVIMTKMDVSSKVTRMNITAEVTGEIKLHLNNLYG